MANKYWRYSVKGHHAEGDLHKLIGSIPNGVVVRIHSEKGDTTVYVAAEKAPEIKEGKVAEVSEADALKIH
jgi:hypothetical protein